VDTGPAIGAAPTARAGKPWAAGPERGIGLYVHIPFCETKCPYCDFNTYAGIEALIPGYMEALEAEVRRWGALLGSTLVRSVFFGGGTPSYVPARRIAGVAAAYREAFRIEQGAEITLEANPGDVTEAKLAAWLGAGVNRLSMGVQSFDDGLLKLLGRRHDAAQAARAARTARRAGFSNFSLDLMFGLPRQSLEQWTNSVARAVDLSPRHLSLYGLQLEHGTPLEAAVRSGEVPQPDDDLAADMFTAAEEVLAGAGYRHYEISNWAKPGCESRHNLIYWRCEPYLGVGPGAHSSLWGLRFANMKSPRGYVQAVNKGRSPTGAMDSGAITWMREHGPVESIEETSEATAMAETMMMGLRLDEGVTESAFSSRFGRGLADVFGDVTTELCDDGLLDQSHGGIRLTARGRLLGNQAFRRFIEAAQSFGPYTGHPAAAAP